MISGLFILFLFLFLGNTTSEILNIPIPGSVIGMLYLTGALRFNIVKLDLVKDAAEVLVKNMAFLFIPPGVGVMLYFNLIGNSFLSIVVSFFLSAILVLIVVGVSQQILDRGKQND
ncbi:CidA/LrgA family protein [Flexistipes sp.]|uniref:CidA/LrgA family protein n=1 Tax=Flexistipes sp. TaxID=3088135 RepID=UPI002E1D7E2B|nr:CidA/LrgA family protein [Flexistipes sp.]